MGHNWYGVLVGVVENSLRERIAFDVYMPVAVACCCCCGGWELGTLVGEFES